MKKLSLLSLAFAAVFASCGGGEKKEETPKTDTVAVEEKKEQKCTYAYVHDSTTVKFTAYKFTEKAGVNGYFDSVVVTGTHDSDTAHQVINGASFTVFVSSVETNDKGRNEKIVKHFFGKMVNTNEITGTVKSVSGDGTKVTFLIKMNDIENEVEAPATWDGERVTLKTDINLEKWNGQAAIDGITKACKANHTGTDGVTKVWPDVTIVITTTLSKICAE
jgi:polyisoprenoid-binding protein YceI